MERDLRIANSRLAESPHSSFLSSKYQKWFRIAILLLIAATGQGCDDCGQRNRRHPLAENDSIVQLPEGTTLPNNVQNTPPLGAISNPASAQILLDHVAGKDPFPEITPQPSPSLPTDYCASGIEDDGIPCTDDSCDAQTGIVKNTPMIEACREKLCAAIAACDPNVGCIYVPKPAGEPCGTPDGETKVCADEACVTPTPIPIPTEIPTATPTPFLPVSSSPMPTSIAPTPSMTATATSTATPTPTPTQSLYVTPNPEPFIAPADHCQNPQFPIPHNNITEVCNRLPPCPADNGDTDRDCDGVSDEIDNCPCHPNAVENSFISFPEQYGIALCCEKHVWQSDVDFDGEGDPCDPDDDGDGMIDRADACPYDQAPLEESSSTYCSYIDMTEAALVCEDGTVDILLTTGEVGIDHDGDGTSTVKDNCPLSRNPDQSNQDGDISGAQCDVDDDGDGIPYPDDICPNVANFYQSNRNLNINEDTCR